MGFAFECPEEWSEQQTFWGRKILHHLPDDERRLVVPHITWNQDAHPITDIMFTCFIFSPESFFSLHEELQTEFEEIEELKSYVPTARDEFTGQALNLFKPFYVRPPELLEVTKQQEADWWQSSQVKQLNEQIKQFLFCQPSRHLFSQIEISLLGGMYLFSWGTSYVRRWWQDEARPLLLNHFYSDVLQSLKETPELLDLLPSKRGYHTGASNISDIKRFGCVYARVKKKSDNHALLVVDVLTRSGFQICDPDSANVRRFCLEENVASDVTPNGQMPSLGERATFLAVLKEALVVQSELLWPLFKISQMLDASEHRVLVDHFAFTKDDETWLKRSVSLSIIHALVDHGYKRHQAVGPLLDWIGLQKHYFELRTGCASPYSYSEAIKAECVLSSLLHEDMWRIREALKKNCVVFPCFQYQKTICRDMMNLQKQLVRFPDDAPDIFRSLRRNLCETREGQVNIPSFLLNKPHFLYWRLLNAYRENHRTFPNMMDWLGMTQKVTCFFDDVCSRLSCDQEMHLVGQEVDDFDDEDWLESFQPINCDKPKETTEVET